MDLVIFDLDGVLIDTLTPNTSAFGAGCEAGGVPRPDKEAVRELLGLPPLEMLLRLGVPSDKASTIYREVVKPAYLSRLAGEVSLYEGVREALEELRARGATMGVATGGVREVQIPVLAKVGLTGYFQEVATSSDMAVSKPSPAFLAAVLSRFTPAPSTVLYVDDTEAGLGMARALGVSCAHASYGYGKVTSFTPEFVLGDIREVPAILEVLRPTRGRKCRIRQDAMGCGRRRMQV